MAGCWVISSLALLRSLHIILAAPIRPQVEAFKNTVEASSSLVPELSASLQARKRAIDLAAEQADRVAEQAMREAQQEQAEEKRLELQFPLPPPPPPLPVVKLAAPMKAASPAVQPKTVAKSPAVQRILPPKAPQHSGVSSKPATDVDAKIEKALRAKFESATPEFIADARERIKKKMHAKLQAKQAENEAVKKVVDARLSAPGAPHLSHAAAARLRKRFEAKLKQRIAAKRGSKSSALVSARKETTDFNSKDDSDSRESGAVDDQDQAQQEVEDDGGSVEEAGGDEASNENADAEVSSDNQMGPLTFLQKPGHAAAMAQLRGPTLFSTEDDDLQPFLHPVSHLEKRRRTVRQAQKAAMGSHEEDSIEDQTLQLKQDVEATLSDIDAADAPADANSPLPAPSPGPAPAQHDVYKLCGELCKHDTGMDGDRDFCVTDCRSYVDAGGDVNSLMDFVTHETYNKQGGEQMEKQFETMTGRDIPDCKPSVSVDKVPTFESLDTDNSGGISRIEVNNWGLKTCVPNELAYQIFALADKNIDGQVSPQEWKDMGELTAIERQIDSWTDKLTKGEDEYHPVHLPAFRHVDSNSDGELDDREIMDCFKRELQRRVPTMSAANREKVAKKYEYPILRDVMKLDLNGDKTINAVEYAQATGKGMGRELYEAAQNPNNLPDPDDLSRTPTNASPAPAAAATPSGIAAPATKAAFLASEAY